MSTTGEEKERERESLGQSSATDEQSKHDKEEMARRWVTGRILSKNTRLVAMAAFPERNKTSGGVFLFLFLGFLVMCPRGYQVHDMIHGFKTSLP